MLFSKRFRSFLLLSLSTIFFVTRVCSQPTKMYMVRASATSSLDALLSANLDGSGLTVLASDAANFGQPGKVFVDKAAGYLYVADAGLSGAGLLRYNLDGTGRTVIIPGITNTVYLGVGINKITNKLYWTVGSGTASLDALMSANLDGTGITTLASGAGNFIQPGDIQLDPAGGYIYLADAGVSGSGILRYNMDGTNRTVITPGVASAIMNGLALDLSGSRIFFSQGSGTSSLDALKVVNLNGTGLTTLAADAANFAQPADVYFDQVNSYLYVGDAGVSAPAGIIRYNLDGTGRTVVIAGTANALYNGVSLDDLLITLPVHLTSFSGRADDRTHILEWVVENEENFSHYELEQDKGNGFVSIARITATASRQYRHSEAVNTAGSFLYRLKMVDKDGSFKYSNTIRLDGRMPVGLQLYPNPSHDWVTASIDQPVKQIRLFNNKGQLIKMISGSSNMVIGFSISGLAKGSYVVQVETATMQYKKSLIVQ